MKPTKIFYLPKIVVCVFVLSISNITVSAQNSTDILINDNFPVVQSFPYEFYGDYAGNLNVSDHTGSLANIPTKFSIRPGDFKGVFNYEFSYSRGKETNVNTYQLYIIDEEKGFYAIKDNAGLEFMATLIKGVLYSTINTKEGSVLTSLHFTNDNKLRFNVIISKTSKAKGKSNMSNVVQIQSAVLSKTN